MVIRLQRLPPPTSHRHCTLEFGICRRRSFRSSWQQLGTSSKRLGTNMFDFGMIERDFEGFNNVLTTPRDEYIVDHHRSRKCFLQLAACSVLRAAFCVLASRSSHSRSSCSPCCSRRLVVGARRPCPSQNRRASTTTYQQQANQTKYLQQQ